MQAIRHPRQAPVLFLVVLLALVAVLVPVGAAHSSSLPGSVLASPLGSTASSTARAQMTHLPISFEVNRGQVDRHVAYLAHLPGATLFLTSSGSVLSLFQSTKSSQGSDANGHDLLNPRLIRPTSPPRTRSMIVGMRFEGANQHPAIVGVSKLPGIVNYFIGNDYTKWHTNIPTYARIAYHNVYPGIDLVYYGNADHLEYDWIVHPGANPKSIKLRVEGTSRLSLDRQGNLRIGTGAGSVLQHAPVFYQTTGRATRRLVSGHYILRGRDVRVWVGQYDQRRPLIVDPTLLYSTYLGGSGNDYGSGIAVDSTGSAYVTGSTASTDFSLQTAFQATLSGSEDVFVTKLAPSGSALVYSTYLGGSGNETGQGIAVDSTGSAYVTGYTFSSDFPVQNAFQSTLSEISGYGVTSDAFVTKLSPSGSSLAYSTYLGGNYTDRGEGIAVDSAGSAYVTGLTQSTQNSPSSYSTNFPTQNAFQSDLNGVQNAFVTKLAPSGSSLVYSTYLGGGKDYGYGIAVDSTGSAYVTGRAEGGFPLQNAFQSTPSGTSDAFVTKFSPSGAALVYSTYLGGSGEDEGDGIAVDSAGNAYVTGHTLSTNFPLLNPLQSTLSGDDDAFVTEVGTSGSSLVYSTYLGGNLDTFGQGIAVDGAGDAYVTGMTSSSDFPLQNPVQSTLGTVNYSAFVTEFAASGWSHVYSTYLGGNAQNLAYSIAVDSTGHAYVTGSTSSPNFPVQNPMQSTLNGPVDAFVTKFPALDAPARPLISTVTAGSTQQYTLTASDGSTWVPIDSTNLTKTVTPVSDSTVSLSGNSDLWTSSAGYNQDLGIWISGGSYGSGQVVAWKESGGFAGTFSPNAAYVHTVLPLQAGITYTMQLVWKSNQPDPGTIWAGAGPIDGAFSPTRLTAETVAATSLTTIGSAASTQQYTLTGSDGTTWMPMDGTKLSESITPTTDSTVTLSGNSDLWTSWAGYNQDIGIWVSGGTYGSGQIVAWKESGGFAGTFSPNAAFVHSVVSLQARTTYTIKLVWKSNKPDSGTIWAGAGPIAGSFSPTRLTAEVVPTGSKPTIATTASTQQYTLQNSDGSTWVPIDGTNLSEAVNPSSDVTAILSGNSDLWTSSAGYNQDIGIWVSGGIYGSGQVVAWKESGGFAGTFSPNAAFVQTVLPLSAGTTYSIQLVWKSNKADPGTIWAGAGPIDGGFSPTRLTAELQP